MKQKHSNQRGYTMMEVILYISILGVLGIVLTNFAYRGFTRYRIGRVAQQVIDLKRAVLQYSAVYDDYLSIKLEDMHNKKSIPLDMRNSTTEARHALGGAVTLGASTDLPYATEDYTDNKYMFYMTFSTISHSSCVEILTQGHFYSDGGDLDSIITNNEDAPGSYNLFYYEHSFFGSSLAKKPENKIKMNRLTVDQAQEACPSQSRNSITWIFS